MPQCIDYNGESRFPLCVYCEESLSMAGSRIENWKGIPRIFKGQCGKISTVHLKHRLGGTFKCWKLLALSRNSIDFPSSISYRISQRMGTERRERKKIKFRVKIQRGSELPKHMPCPFKDTSNKCNICCSSTGLRCFTSYFHSCSFSYPLWKMRVLPVLAHRGVEAEAGQQYTTLKLGFLL
jgi:hypothetical protein